MGNYKSGKETMEKILSAARKLFYEEGYTKATLTEISRHSGANKAMVSYYFGSKEKLAIEIYNTYMVASKVITQRKITEIEPQTDALLRTAVDFRIQNRNCRTNANLNRFYHEMCETNVFMKEESASISFLENINRSLKLGLSRLEVKTLSIANLSLVHGLHTAWSSGFIDCSSEYLAETEIQLLLQSIKIPEAQIEEIIQSSKALAGKIHISVEKNFKVVSK
ncbi:MAG: TetR/AcrR family transcriptional regulator [Eubacterium sp.]|nr:TetR/AcrR family transcriptional regulator [Eubacterium sp.]